MVTVAEVLLGCQVMVHALHVSSLVGRLLTAEGRRKLCDCRRQVQGDTDGSGVTVTTSNVASLGQVLDKGLCNSVEFSRAQSIRDSITSSSWPIHDFTPRAGHLEYDA
jgi:hypothetical protein